MNKPIIRMVSALALVILATGASLMPATASDVPISQGHVSFTLQMEAEPHKLTANDGASDDRFGWSTAISCT